MNLLKKLADVISFADGERWHPSIATFTGNTRDLDPNDDLIKWAKKVEKLPFIGTAMGGVSMHLYEVTCTAGSLRESGTAALIRKRKEEPGGRTEESSISPAETTVNDTAYAVPFQNKKR